MHILVPHFILENDAQDKRQGSFDAVGLFVDVSGFSTMADAMMQQGHNPFFAEQILRHVQERGLRAEHANG